MSLPAVVATAIIAVVGIGYGQFIKSTTDCTCPGDVVTYNCNVTGSGFTIWRGSAFDCPSVDSRVLLRHSSFGANGGTMGLCNDGAIMGRSIGTTTSRSNSPVYMSQLTVDLRASSNVIGQAVECVYRNIAGVERTIGSETIEITDPLPPPTIVQLVGTSSKQLVFNWTSVDSDCSTLQYNIISSCGNCANMTTVSTTSVACSIGSVDDNETQCSFGVRSVVCANISGIPSEPLDVTLKAPESPIITNIVARYNEQGKKLTNLDIKFNEVERFLISEGVDGSAHSYTISYTDSGTGTMCSSLTISATSCKQGICTVPFISPLPCSETIGDADMDISISAENYLGRGPSTIFSLGRTNRHVSITFLNQPTNKIVCTFLDQQEGQGTVSCDVAYGPCQKQPAAIARGTVSADSNVVNIAINPQTSEYCYVVNASNGTFTVQIEGQITTSTGAGPITTEQPPNNDSPSQTNEGLVAGVSITVILLFVVSVTVVCMYVLWLRKTTKGSEEEVHLLKDEQLQQVNAHICVNLDDKPKELMSALQKLDSLQINIKNIKVGRCTSLDKRAVREVCIECWKDLTDKEEQGIKGLQIGVAGTLRVSCKAEDHYIRENRRDPKGTQPRFDITEILQDKPGALLSLLKVVDSVEECQRINITDIDANKLQNEGREDCTQVTIMFLPDMAEGWKEKYDKRRDECKSIVNLPTEDTTVTVTMTEV